MANVTLKGIKKAYDSNVVIEDIDLEIKDKEFLVLVGASGCGKSTILRMIAGLEDITDGEIYIGDRKVNKVAPKDRDIAFVFQSYALYPHMTVRENIAFGLKMRKFKADFIERKVNEAAEILNLTELLDRKPRQLSGGQRQRVALGRAIVREPKVFLMDEPLSNLDAKLRVQMRSEIKKLHEKLKTTFIYVTHDQTEALTMGDRIVVLDKGVIQQVDTPDNIYKNPSNVFVAGFVGSPQMNFLDATVINDTMVVGDIPIHPTEEQKIVIGNRRNIVIGVRPENMSNPDGEIKLVVKVDMTEMLGSEKIVYFFVANTRCCVKVPPTFVVDEDIVIKIDKRSLLLFDKTNGKRIY